MLKYKFLFFQEIGRYFFSPNFNFLNLIFLELFDYYKLSCDLSDFIY